MLHSSVAGFMGGLKALPKGSAERGKFITSHMNHAPFQSALQSHPQGTQIRSMLNQHLNSKANAGVKPGSTVFKAASVRSFFRELDKIAGAASIGGLAGLTALEGAGALDKEKPKKERAMQAGSAAFTGSILADELHHSGHLGKLKSLLTKRAGMRPGGQAAIMKSVAKHGLRPEMAAKHGLTQAAHAAPAAVAHPVQRQDPSSYSDFMPAGHFTQQGSGLPTQQMRQRSQTMAKQVAPAARAANVFKGV